MSVVQPSAYIFKERRSSERHDVMIAAKAIMPYINDAINCTVLDISESGARVELIGVDIVPSNLKLYLPETRTLRDCRVVRQSGNQIGLEFESRIDLKAE